LAEPKVNNPPIAVDFSGKFGRIIKVWADWFRLITRKANDADPGFTTVTLESSTSEPSGVTSGMFAVADNSSWDPAAKGGGAPYPVFYDGTNWNALY